MGRKVYINLLNICAAFSVVWIHFGNEIHWYDGSAAWRMCVPIQVLAYWAVPVYFMITGATLMNYRQKYNTKVFFSRRLVRGVMPYLVWGTIMMFLYRERVFTPNAGVTRTISDIIHGFLNNTMEPVYWFFLPLIAVYLSMPILSLLAEEKNRLVLHYALVFGIAFISVMPFSYNLFYYIFFPEWGRYWNGLLTAPTLGGYTIYCVLGYWASTHSFTYRQRCACYLLGGLGAIVRFAGLWHFSSRDGVTSQIFMDYLSWPALTLALAIFVAFRYTQWDKILSDRAKCIVNYLSSCGLGVYVTHSVLIRKMGAIEIFNRYSPEWYYFWPIPTFIICIMSIAIVKKVPILRRLFP